VYALAVERVLRVSITLREREDGWRSLSSLFCLTPIRTKGKAFANNVCAKREERRHMENFFLRLVPGIHWRVLLEQEKKREGKGRRGMRKMSPDVRRERERGGRALLVHHWRVCGSGSSVREEGKRVDRVRQHFRREKKKSGVRAVPSESRFEEDHVSSSYMKKEEETGVGSRVRGKRGERLYSWR